MIAIGAVQAMYGSAFPGSWVGLAGRQVIPSALSGIAELTLVVVASLRWLARRA